MRRPSAVWLEIGRNVAYWGFGAWAMVNTIRTPGFGWLHAIFLVFALGFVVAGVLLEVQRIAHRRVGWIAHVIIAVSMAVLGLLLLIVGRSPFGLLTLGLAFAAARDGRRAATGAGDGPSAT